VIVITPELLFNSKCMYVQERDLELEMGDDYYLDLKSMFYVAF